MNLNELNICYGPVTAGLDGGGQTGQKGKLVVTDWHTTKNSGPVSLELDGKKVEITIEKHDGHQAIGTLHYGDESATFDLLKRERKNLEIGGQKFWIKHGNKGEAPEIVEV